MTSQTGKARVDWRRALVGGVLAAGLMSGFGASTAFAQPAEPTNPSPPRSCTGDDCTKDAEAAVAAAAGCEPDDKKCSEAANKPKKVNGDQILLAIYEEYRSGEGGGQVSKLIDDAVNLRKQGFPISSANAQALQDALDDRPNQKPLIEALQSAIQYQRKIMEQQAMAASQQQGQSGQMGTGSGGGAVPIIPPQQGGPIAPQG
ncbi:hypothetical protein BST36_13925 [Mycolicibacterium moriokaense]|jgi:hypothetical protein|uniref:Uncharacterized protein n=1 Tax=Mycolicibacterium moriokaense TaxID=39691 RepID=A0AAD1HB86_9MYCO|nr:hypothetical protein [Mycolicibacterium moriokaense]MCV7038709.1 hypothetical protein [Mycolicibacterium moriokaense]ORB22515.1 hypothetical protein BST36_13925 [Mycolicibacterium moriokaense]BBX02233.1 hypothetical protein MMOR_31690 [Mycolicibacterium moriokaense]